MWSEKNAGSLRRWIRASILALGLLAAGLAAQEGPREPVAEMKAGTDRIEWRPRVPYERIVLTVSGAGRVIESAFEAGKNPAFDLRRDGKPLPDGTYRYRLSVVPKLDLELRQRLGADRPQTEVGLHDGRERGDAAVASELRGPFVQIGVFTIHRGALVDREVKETPTPHQRPEEPRFKSGGDLILWGDLTVRGVKTSAALDPENAERAIYFAALEGPEVGTYYRGSAKLEGGEAVIELPAAFAKLTEARGLTVQLTPVGAWSRLYVAEKSPKRLVVRQAEGDRAVKFDFLVQGVRKGHAKFEVERASAGDALLFPERAGSGEPQP